MAINKTVVRGQCGNCGWPTKRQIKNMRKPCPKCGGQMVVNQDDQSGVLAMWIVALIIMGSVAIVMTALGYN